LPKNIKRAGKQELILEDRSMGMMDGKICIVTGATAGIGYYTALEIARKGGSVIIVGRNDTKCIETAHSLEEASGNNPVDYLIADLSSQAQIHSLADEFYRRFNHLDVLVNNAGGFFMRRKLSVDGLEMTFALNHLAYFLLTMLLLDALKASPKARIVNVSSGSHLHQHIDFNDLQLASFYNPIKAYGRSKFANILFTYELSRHLIGSNITANALTPGMVATDIWKKVNRWLTPLINPVMQRIAQTPLEGAQTSIYLATSPDMEGVTGKYFANQRPIPSDPGTYDLEAAQKLWQMSLGLVHLESKP
jgi:NAD(P)-dependent dehydrogenase (short-subunit alcohol dehydrogenase family)